MVHFTPSQVQSVIEVEKIYVIQRSGKDFTSILAKSKGTVKAILSKKGEKASNRYLQFGCVRLMPN
jgi:hypothetical protein